MESGDSPRHTRSSVKNGVLPIHLDVEHDVEIRLVKASFRHEVWDTVVKDFSSRLVRHTSSFSFLTGRPKRARVLLEASSGTEWIPGWYRLEQLKARGSRDIQWRDASIPTEQRRFYLEEEPDQPHYETNVRQYKQGEELSLTVEASESGGVGGVQVEFSGGYVYPRQGISLRGDGNGIRECTVSLKGRIASTQAPGRYRAYEMKVWSRGTRRDPFLDRRGVNARTKKLNPPAVFEVVKNEDLPPKQVPRPEPKGPNWGFSD